MAFLLKINPLAYILFWFFPRLSTEDVFLDEPRDCFCDSGLLRAECFELRRKKYLLIKTDLKNATAAPFMCIHCQLWLRFQISATMTTFRCGWSAVAVACQRCPPKRTPGIINIRSGSWASWSMTIIVYSLSLSSAWHEARASKELWLLLSVNQLAFADKLTKGFHASNIVCVQNGIIADIFVSFSTLGMLSWLLGRVWEVCYTIVAVQC